MTHDDEIPNSTTVEASRDFHNALQICSNSNPTFAFIFERLTSGMTAEDFSDDPESYESGRHRKTYHRSFFSYVAELQDFWTDSFAQCLQRASSFFWFFTRKRKQNATQILSEWHSAK